MLQQLSLNEFLELSKIEKRVAVFREIAADRLTPVSIVESLHEEMQDGVILESGLHHHDGGRYSFIAFDPMAQVSVQNKKVTQRVGQEITSSSMPPFPIIRKLLSQLSCVEKPQQRDFIHGAIGFITYDAVRYFENIPDQHFSENPLPDMLFNFYKTTLMFDHLQQKLLISTAVDVGADPTATYQATQAEINALIDKIQTSIHPELSPLVSSEQPQTAEVDVDISDAQFMLLVDQAKQQIIAGNAFQIVLSRRFLKQYTAQPFDIYRALRRISPAPYMFYFPTENGIIIGASPEKLISVRQKHVEINPIAGTRARTTQKKDEDITTELLNDQKECAEHIMLVDLARNDLGAICEPGSIQVKELLKVKHFSHTSHITSMVTGKLREDKDSLDALAAAFPAGTLSGAPKIRAMQIIDELETSKRGIYGGAICRLDSQGNLDSCIAIRLALLKEGVATVRTGAGIVYDSDPQSEADETRLKAKGVLDAIALAQEAIV
jgi:anthranilate synthase component I